MSIDGTEWDVPDTPANAAFFGFTGTGKDGAPGAFPKARMVTVNECASHAAVLAAIGPAAWKGSGEQSLARNLYPRLEEDWLLIADRNFYNWQDWCTAAETGAALLWRVRADLQLPVLELLPDGSYRSVLVAPRVTGAARKRITEAARSGEALDPAMARRVRVVEYEVPDRDGDDELIALVTTITDSREAPAASLAAHHERWEHEGANAQLKTFLRGPGKILRSQSPPMVEQELRGYLLTHYARIAAGRRADLQHRLQFALLGGGELALSPGRPLGGQRRARPPAATGSPTSATPGTASLSPGRWPRPRSSRRRPAAPAPGEPGPLRSARRHRDTSCLWHSAPCAG